MFAPSKYSIFGSTNAQQKAASMSAERAALDTSSLPSQASSLPLWDRLSLWASENKAVVYTIAGVAVVISSAGVIYYLSESRKGDATEEKKRASKRDKRKNKKDKGQEQDTSEARPIDQQPAEQGMLHSISKW